MQRYARGDFAATSAPTIGVDFALKVVEVDERTQVRIQLWDTAGQEKYMSLVTMYLRSCYLFLIVFDLTDWESFACAALWLSRLRDCRHGGAARRSAEAGGLDIVLVGNMADRAADERAVPIDAARQWATENGLAAYYEVSAKTGAGVCDAFEQSVRRILPNLAAAVEAEVDGVLFQPSTSCVVDGVGERGAVGARARRRALEMWKGRESLARRVRLTGIRGHRRGDTGADCC